MKKLWFVITNWVSIIHFIYSEMPKIRDVQLSLAMLRSQVEEDFAELRRELKRELEADRAEFKAFTAKALVKRDIAMFKANEIKHDVNHQQIHDSLEPKQSNFISIRHA